MPSPRRRRSLITSYGLFWKLDETEWFASDGHKAKRRLLGRLSKRGTELRVADFWSQVGIYALYGNYGLYYVGVSSHQLGKRIHDHISDPHRGRWDRFSWFGFREVTANHDADGFLRLAETERYLSIGLSAARHDIEAILFRAFAGPGNSAHPRFGAKLEEWKQISLAKLPRVEEKLKANLT